MLWIPDDSESVDMLNVNCILLIFFWIFCHQKLRYRYFFKWVSNQTQRVAANLQNLGAAGLYLIYTTVINNFYLPSPQVFIGYVSLPVCFAVWKNRHMRTVTNYFIVNLSLADVLVTIICLPASLVVDITETWFFGQTLCKIVPYLQVGLLPFMSDSQILKLAGQKKRSMNARRDLPSHK